mmetsp:Transcript_29473/g.54692  ORF Transcript_29473/g.54692 Transcript_29473/m.54692 type:complete len:141 (-) Transcript_29473:777-1199(-)
MLMPVNENFRLSGPDPSSSALLPIEAKLPKLLREFLLAAPDPGLDPLSSPLLPTEKLPKLLREFLLELASSLPSADEWRLTKLDRERTDPLRKVPSSPVATALPKDCRALDSRRELAPSSALPTDLCPSDSRWENLFRPM